jgi:hypothetical protein
VSLVGILLTLHLRLHLAEVCLRLCHRHRLQLCFRKPSQASRSCFPRPPPSALKHFSGSASRSTLKLRSCPEAQRKLHRTGTYVQGPDSGLFFGCPGISRPRFSLLKLCVFSLEVCQLTFFPKIRSALRFAVSSRRRAGDSSLIDT